MPHLTQAELQQLRSLSESELLDYLGQLPDDVLDEIVCEIDGVGVANFAETRSARNAAAINAKTAIAQEIGPLPPVANPERRAKCAASNLAFSEIYFPRTFFMGWAPYQRDMMDRFQEVVLSGGKKCRAVKRGGLKSTCARASTVWAAVNGHSRFPVLVGATDDKANEHRENFFSLLASSDLLIADYPELLPLLMKWRQPKRQFRLNGRLLNVHPKDDRGRIVFADIHESPSCEVHIAPYSVNATDVSGLSYVNRFGETVRPDLLVFDDVQTPQSANSPLMTEGLEQRIDKTFGGLFALGSVPREIMVCTVRRKDCLTERYLDRKKHPDWDGRLYPSVIRMPDRMDLWEQYRAILHTGETPEVGKAAGQRFYLENQAVMDAGAKVAWERDKQESEITALQSLMTVWALDNEYFRCEIQQEGIAAANTSGIKLDAQTLLGRLSRVNRGDIPPGASYTTAFIDSSDQVLWWMVCSWAKDFSGWIVDYGTWPHQGREVFYKSDLVHKISGLIPGASWEECFVLAHQQLEAGLLTKWPGIDLILKDWADGQHKPRIESQIMQSADRHRIRPYKGAYVKPGRKPVHEWGDQYKDRNTRSQWVERRSETPVHVQANANVWRSHVARRLLTTAGAPSSLLLPGTAEIENRLLVEHLTSEQPKEIAYDGTPGVAWEMIPGRDNDWWDCLVGNSVAASMLGCTLTGEQPAKPRKSFHGGQRSGR